MTARLPVTHPQYIRTTAEPGVHDRYVLGYATSELGALRVLRKLASDIAAVETAKVRGVEVWQPRPAKKSHG
jgi:hypothetical protein